MKNKKLWWLKWSFLPLLSLGFGLFLWFLDSTDFSLRGTIPDLIFPFLVGIIGLASLSKVKYTSGKAMKTVICLVSLPSISGAVLYIFVGFLLFVSPFFLSTLFSIAEIAGEKSLQEIASPDGIQVAEVRFRETGAYTGGRGRIFVSVRHFLFPILEQDVYYTKVYFNTAEHITWISNETLFISETKEEVLVGELKWHIPEVIQTSLNMVHRLTEIGNQAQRERELSIPVSNVPIFNGAITHDQSQYNEKKETAFRSFNVLNHNLNDIVAWYEQVLSNHPWELNRVDHHIVEDLRGARTRYCLQAQWQDSNESALYYWEFMGTEDRADGVHVNIGTPNPITDTCRQYLEE